MELAFPNMCETLEARPSALCVPSWARDFPKPRELPCFPSACELELVRRPSYIVPSRYLQLPLKEKPLILQARVKYIVHNAQSISDLVPLDMRANNLVSSTMIEHWLTDTKY